MRLKADNIKFGYTGNHRVLNHVDFTVEEGEVTGLIAPSGYGKTTLAKILAGYIKPEQALNPKWKMKKVLEEIGMPPKAMLDAITQAQIWNLVLDYAKTPQMGIVVISHEKELIHRLCSRIVSVKVLNRYEK